MKKIKSKPLVTLSIKIDNDLKQFLTEASKNEHRSVSNFVVNALYYYKGKINEQNMNKKS